MILNEPNAKCKDLVDQWEEIVLFVCIYEKKHDVNVLKEGNKGKEHIEKEENLFVRVEAIEFYVCLEVELLVANYFRLARFAVSENL